jgi:hypothetical protein
MAYHTSAGVSNATIPAPIQTQVCSSPAGPSGQQNLAVVTAAAHDLTDSRSGWLDGIFGCFRPVFWNLTAKANKGRELLLFKMCVPISKYSLVGLPE